MDLLIKNGRIVTATDSFQADVAVKDGKIIQIGTELAALPETEVVDAAGKLVLPGAIDAHTHLAMPFGGTVSADDYFAGTRAAACGGTTTVFDFVLQDFGESMVDAIKRRDALCAPVATVDYSYHVAVKDVSGGLLDTIEDAVKFGVPSFKVFMVYDFGVLSSFEKSKGMRRTDRCSCRKQRAGEHADGRISERRKNKRLVSLYVPSGIR